VVRGSYRLEDTGKPGVLFLVYFDEAKTNHIT
jgi:hypothetical protein